MLIIPTGGNLMNTHIGKKRSSLAALITLTCIIFILFSLYFLCSIPFGVHTVYITPALLITLIIGYEGYVRYSNTYYIRKIQDDEWEQILTRKIIHYTNYIADEEYKRFLTTGIISLNGSIKAESNYVMKIKDKRKPHVWFHVEDPLNPGEPDLKSFLFSHMHESTPRKYKVIIEPKELNKTNIFIRPSNGNNIYAGNLAVKAQIETTFNWYNEKLYLKSIIWPSIISSITISTYLCSFHQLLGKFMDKLASWFKILDKNTS